MRRDGHAVLGAVALRRGHENAGGAEVGGLAARRRAIELAHVGGGSLASVNMSSTVVTPNTAASRSALPQVCVCESMRPGSSVFPLPSTTGVRLGAVIDGATARDAPVGHEHAGLRDDALAVEHRTFWISTEPSTASRAAGVC